MTWTWVRSMFDRPRRRSLYRHCPKKYHKEFNSKTTRTYEEYATDRDYFFDGRKMAPPGNFLPFLTYDETQFRIFVDVSLFAPGELALKRVGGFVILEGMHDDKVDQVRDMYLHYKRWYPIPPDCDPTTVKCERYHDNKIIIFIDKCPESNKNEIDLAPYFDDKIKTETLAEKNDEMPFKKTDSKIIEIVHVSKDHIMSTAPSFLCKSAKRFIIPATETMKVITDAPYPINDKYAKRLTYEVTFITRNSNKKKEGGKWRNFFYCLN